MADTRASFHHKLDQPFVTQGLIEQQQLQPIIEAVGTHTCALFVHSRKTPLCLYIL